MPELIDNQGVLDAVLSVESYLHPSLRGPTSPMLNICARLEAGELVVIRSAFESTYAERMHRSLDACTTWQVYEGYEGNFHYHHHNLYDEDKYPPDIAWCEKVFDSPNTKNWVTRWSGRSCTGPTVFSASWYLPGDHSLPHTDAIASGGNARRQVAFVWHLTKDWRPEWGGALFWCPRALYVPPAFNTLVLFNVGLHTSHFVTHVSPYAQGKRLAINGWWTGPALAGNSVLPSPDRIDLTGTVIEIY